MLHLSAERDELIGFVNTASHFVVEHQGTYSHLKSILVVADEKSGTVTFRAENETSAVDFSTDEIDVKGSGAILVDAARLSAALSVMRNVEPVTLEQMTGNPDRPGKRLHIFSGDTNVDVIVDNIDLSDAKALIPSIGEPAKESIVMLSEDFAEAHAQGSVGYDVEQSVIQDVVFETMNGSLRIGSMRKNGSITYSNAPTLGDGSFVALFVPSVLAKLAHYARSSDLIELAYGNDRTEIHMMTYRFIPPAKPEPKANVKKEKEEARPELVENPSDHTSYEPLMHLRFALSSRDVSKHPMNSQSENSQRVFAGIGQFIQNRAGTVVVSREDFFDLMSRAERMRALNVQAGSDRSSIEVAIADGQIKAKIDGESPFSDQIAIHSGQSDDQTFLINWNLYAPFYGTYPNSELMPLHLVARGGNVVAIMLLDEEDLDENGIPQTYLAVAPTSKSKS